MKLKQFIKDFDFEKPDWTVLPEGFPFCNTSRLNTEESGLYSGNVGIGTTSPIGKLHVATECIVEGSLIRRKRKKKKKGEPDWEDVPIEDIEPGDEVLTLDEKTDKLVWQKVKKPLNKGVKKVYELKTASGKSIETTSNHPYLALDMAALLKNKPKAGVFIDDSNLYHAYKKAGWRIDFAKFKKSLESAFDVSFINYYMAVPDEKDKSLEGTLNFIRKLPSDITLKTKPLKYLNGRKEKKGDVDVEISVDVFRSVDDLDLVIIVTGDSDYQELAQFVMKDAGKNVLFVGFNENMAWELRQLKHFYLNEMKKEIKLGGRKTNTPQKVQGALLGVLYQNRQIVSIPRKWTEAAKLAEGQMIAVTKEDKDSPVWDRIVSIKETGRKQVCDLSIEKTHNFVANEIIAHNTTNLTGKSALIVDQLESEDVFTASASGTPKFVIDNSGNVGIGTTSPSQKLHVVGQCVAGDTLLPIRRRRRRKKKKVGTEPNPDDVFWDYLLCRIDEVIAGDEILLLSLNEATGALKYAIAVLEEAMLYCKPGSSLS